MQTFLISRFEISTFPESTTDSPGPKTERTLGPNPPVVPGHEFWLLPSMKFEPSMATPAPLVVTTAGPTIEGRKLLSLITKGDVAGTIWIVFPPGLALFCMIAQRRV